MAIIEEGKAGRCALAKAAGPDPTNFLAAASVHVPILADCPSSATESTSNWTGVLTNAGNK